MGWLGGAGYILTENKNWLERKIVHILLSETEIQERVMLRCLCVHVHYSCLVMGEMQFILYSITTFEIMT